MPTYSYKCTICDNAFDIQQSFTEDSLTECPECSGKLRKLYSAVGVSFTGSGFYRNDSRAAAGTGSGGTRKDSAGAKDSTGTKDSAGKAKETVSSAPASGSAGSSSGSTTAAAS